MKIFLVALVLVVLVGGGWWLWFSYVEHEPQPLVVEQIQTSESTQEQDEASRESIVQSAPQPEPPKPVVRSVQYTVPFTSQAPTGDWSQSAFQDGCEEASALMVWLAREGKALSSLEVKAKLLDMADFQSKRLGHGVDTDAADTEALLIEEYFSINDAEIVYDFSLEELKLALQAGPVIVPTDGRALRNPNFTQPGPLQHMLVITGYDMATREFVTNDPGTRKGEGYRYPEQVLYDAIREYPTGQHLPIKTERKAMIVVPFTAPQP